MMKRPWFLLTLALTLCVAAMAQTPPPNIVGTPPPRTPVDPTAILVSLAENGAWQDWAEGSFNKLGQNQASDETAIQQLIQANKDLSSQLQLLNDRVTKLENPPPSTTQLTSVTFTGIPDGPISGIQQNVVDLGTANWNVNSGNLMPAFSGRSRSFSILPGHALVGVKAFAVDPTKLPTLALTIGAQVCQMGLTATPQALNCGTAKAPLGAALVVTITYPGGSDALQGRFTEIDVQ